MSRTILTLVTTAVIAVGCSGTYDDMTSTPPAATDTPSASLESVIDDVRDVAPALESFYRGGTYPTDLAEVRRSLADARLSLTGENVLGSYRYDPDTVEFALCIEHPSGAFATYDTAPMSTRETGETGGCPTL